MPRRDSPYNAAYQAERARLLAGRPRCEICRRVEADSADHDPPLWQHTHVPGSGCCRLRPTCMPCNLRETGGWRAANRARRARRRGSGIPAPSRKW